MKKMSIAILIFSVVFSMFMYINKVYATNDFWTQANDWYDKGLSEYDDPDTTEVEGIDNMATVNTVIKPVIDDLSKMINIVGTTIIVCVTTFLGIKYMFGSVDSKSEVKESLLTLVVACVFFFGWNSIWGLIFNNGSLRFNPIKDSAGNYTTYETIVANIFKTLSLIANILAILGVIYVGIRYIFAGAQGKAELKGKSMHFLIGVVLAFCSVGVLNYISAVITDLFAAP